jgi:hypothetical protein
MAWLVEDGVTNYNWVVVDGARYPVTRGLIREEYRKGRGPELLCSYEDADGEMYLWIECIKCGPEGSNRCNCWN